MNLRLIILIFSINDFYIYFSIVVLINLFLRFSEGWFTRLDIFVFAINFEYIIVYSCIECCILFLIFLINFLFDFKTEYLKKNPELLTLFFICFGYSSCF